MLLIARPAVVGLGRRRQSLVNAAVYRGHADRGRVVAISSIVADSPRTD